MKPHGISTLLLVLCALVAFVSSALFCLLHGRGGELFSSLLFYGFGFWWLLFPDSVARFYTRFHDGNVVIPKPVAIRVMGCFVVVAFALFVCFANR